MLASPRLHSSPQPSTSGMGKNSFHEQDYELDYDSDWYADSDSELYCHARASFGNIEQWKCNICNKLFKSLKEKLLHAGQHSPRCEMLSSLSQLNASFQEGEMQIKSVLNQATSKEEGGDIKVFDGLLKSDIITKDDSNAAVSIKSSEASQMTTTTNDSNAELKAQQILMTVEACRLASADYKCPECSVIFSNSDDLLKHRKQALQSKFICPLCHQEFVRYHDKYQHIRATHNTASISCPFCYLTYKSLQTWCKHQLQHCGIVFFECEECGKKFNRKFSYEIHKQSHMVDKPFSCHECEKSFSNSTYLRRHLFTHMDNQEMKCDICGKMYKNCRTLMKHKNLVHPSNPHKIVRDYICSHENCGLIFRSAKKLAWHKEVHQRWPKRCEFCQERFVHASNLVKHIRTKHNDQYLKENEGNKSCPICFKVLLKSSLVQHMRIHSGVRPFKCHMCNKSFRVKCNLDAHMHKTKVPA